MRTTSHVMFLLELNYRMKRNVEGFYDIMIQATDNTIQNKWERDFGNISQNELQKYNSMIKDLNEVPLKDFQFKIINKILVTKSFLQRIGKLAESQCLYYIEKPETMLHLFTECEKVNRFWQELRTWVFSHTNLYLNIVNKPIKIIIYWLIIIIIKSLFSEDYILSTGIYLTYGPLNIKIT